MQLYNKPQDSVAFEQSRVGVIFRASKIVPCFPYFFSQTMIPKESLIKLIHCVRFVLFLSNKSSSDYIHIALLQQIRGTLFFCSKWCNMTYENQKKIYLCIQVKVAIVSSVQEILHKCVCSGFSM